MSAQLNQRKKLNPNPEPHVGEPQLKKIRELWHSVARTPTDEALRAFIYKITFKQYLHIDALTKTDAQKMIVVLMKMEEGS